MRTSLLEIADERVMTFWQVLLLGRVSADAVFVLQAIFQGGTPGGMRKLSLTASFPQKNN
jgi:hypothetical protein